MCYGSKHLLFRIETSLNDVYFDLIIRLIVIPHHTVKLRVPKTVFINVFEKISRGDRRFIRVYLNSEIAQLRTYQQVCLIVRTIEIKRT